MPKSKKLTPKAARRQRVKRGIRSKIDGTPQRPRLTVYRSNAHIYAQLIDDRAGHTLAAASSLEDGVEGGSGRIIEYYGPGLDGLAAGRGSVAEWADSLPQYVIEAHAREEGQAEAQSQGQGEGQGITVDIVPATQWTYDEAYEGWSAEELLGEEVYGETGDVVGEIEDFIIGPDGKIQKVVVEGGGFLDIGDSHVAVPWNQVTRIGVASIRAPLTEENIDEYGMFENVEDMPPRPDNFRLRELLNDYLTADGVGYGTVEDVIFTQDGKIDAVIVYGAYGYGYDRGPVALPYYPERYDPYGPYYEVPYGAEELSEVRPFDYGQLD